MADTKKMDSIYAFMGIKIFKLIISYISINIAANYTSQIYIDKVLVNRENPPHPSNMIILYLLIEFCMYVMFISVVYFALSSFDQIDDDSDLLSFILPDYILSCIISGIVLNIIGNIIYSRKYFLYKDDGLSGIRAFKDIMIQYSFLNNLLPYNFMFKGFIERVQEYTSANE